MRAGAALPAEIRDSIHYSMTGSRAFALLLLLAATSVASAQQAAPVPASAAARRALLLDPTRPFWKSRAPDTVTAEVVTSKGTMTLELIREWAPAGVDRFYNLARAGYYDDSRFYRVLYFFIAQFGVAGDPSVGKAWARQNIPADTPREKNVRGTLAFAQSKPGDRTTHVFINLNDNPSLDTLKFVPFARVVSGMDVADSLYARYGEAPVSELGGNPRRLSSEANKYLDADFPKLDKLLRIIIRPEAAPQ